MATRVTQRALNPHSPAGKGRRHGWQAYAGLALCTVCMAAAAQLIQFSKRRTGTYTYSYYTLNTMVEATKLVLAAAGLASQFRHDGVRGIVGAFRAIPAFVYPRYAIPAGIYLINNNVYYVILYFMDAATFQVVMSLKIVSTGVLMYLLLNKHLSRAQWVALGVLTVASVLAQLDKQGAATSAARHASVMGFVIATVYCGLSGLAGVSTEALLKGKHNAPLQACNVLLYTYGVVFNLLAYAVLEKDRATGITGFFAGVDGVTLCIVANSAVMGMLISAIMKYFDNIVKVYLNSVAILLSMAVSSHIGTFQPSFQFLLSVVLVTVSAVAYNTNSWGPLQPYLAVNAGANAIARERHDVSVGGALEAARVKSGATANVT